MTAHLGPSSEHPAHPKYDVYRDKDGNPVTITQEQMAAIWHAIGVVDSVRREQEQSGLFTEDVWGDTPVTEWNPKGRGIVSQKPRSNTAAELGKSRLLGRLLLDGRPPFAEPAPNYLTACGYHFWEPGVFHYYLGCVFEATVVGGVVTEIHIPTEPE